MEERNSLSLKPPKDIKAYNIVDSNDYLELTSGDEYKLEYTDNPTYWRIQVFVTSELEKAEEIKEDLFSSGYENTYIARKGELYKVQLGNFQKEEKVSAVEEKLEEEDWDTWVISFSDDLGRAIAVYKEEELLFTAPGFRIQGDILLEDNYYPGEFEISISGEKLSIYNKVQLRDLLYGLMASFDEIDGGRYPSILKARAIAVRSYIFSVLFEGKKSYIYFPGYQGTKEVNNYIRDAVNSTDGIVLKEGELPAVSSDGYSVLLGSSDDRHEMDYVYELARIFALEEKGLNYREILSELYPEFEQVDLKENIESEQRVEARVFYGLRYREFRELTWWGPRVISILDLDLSKAHFTVDTVLAGNKITGLEAVGDMVRRNNALGGINGTFYQANGRPLGLVIKNGEILSEPVYERTAFGINSIGEILIDRIGWQGELFYKENKSLVLNGVNRSPSNDQAVLLNKAYGEKAPALSDNTLELIVENNRLVKVVKGWEESGRRSTLPENGFIIQIRGEKVDIAVDFEPGEEIQIQNSFSNEKWNQFDIVTAMGAGPNLITDGKIDITGTEEQFQSDILYGRAPRSALGITENNHLLLFTVDGRQQNLSIGMTLTELAEFMLKFDVHDGMNLDGGDSARMAVRGYTMNNPRFNRNTGSGIIIYRE